jgi:hypothetical protein
MWVAIGLPVLLFVALTLLVWADVRRRVRDGADPEALRPIERYRYYRDHRD